MILTLQQAEAIVAAGTARAKAIGIAANIAVLGSIDVSIGKARTSALFQINSEAVWDYCKPGAPAHNLEASNGGLMPFAGGLPVLAADGTMIGAVGVSGGAPSQDLEIAEAAVAALPR